jgi:hypothetical protein
MRVAGDAAPCHVTARRCIVWCMCLCTNAQGTTKRRPSADVHILRLLQGMTVGIMQAVLLHEIAAERLGRAAGSGTEAKRVALQGLSAAFHAKLPELLEFPWNLATGALLTTRPRRSEQSQFEVQVDG